MRMVTRNLSKIRTFDAGPKTGKWHQKPPMVRTFCELTEIKMNENEYDILCKRLDFFFSEDCLFHNIGFREFFKGSFLEEIIVLDF